MTQQRPPRTIGIQSLRGAAFVTPDGGGLDERLGHPLLFEQNRVDLSHPEQMRDGVPGVKPQDAPLGDTREQICAAKLDGTQQHGCPPAGTRVSELLPHCELRRAHANVDVLVSDEQLLRTGPRSIEVHDVHAAQAAMLHPRLQVRPQPLWCHRRAQASWVLVVIVQRRSTWTSPSSCAKPVELGPGLVDRKTRAVASHDGHTRPALGDRWRRYRRRHRCRRRADQLHRVAIRLRDGGFELDRELIRGNGVSERSDNLDEPGLVGSSATDRNTEQLPALAIQGGANILRRRKRGADVLLARQRSCREVIDHRHRVRGSDELLGEAGGHPRGVQTVTRIHITAKLAQTRLDHGNERLHRRQERLRLRAKARDERLEAAARRVDVSDAENRGGPSSSGLPSLLAGELRADELEVVIKLVQRRLRRPAVLPEHATTLRRVHQNHKGLEVSRKPERLRFVRPSAASHPR